MIRVRVLQFTVALGWMHMAVSITEQGLKISKCFCELWPAATDPKDSTGSRCFSKPGILSWRQGILARKQSRDKNKCKSKWNYLLILISASSLSKLLKLMFNMKIRSLAGLYPKSVIYSHFVYALFTLHLRYLNSQGPRANDLGEIKNQLANLRLG